MGILAFALRTIHELLSYYPVLLPTLLIFSLESVSSAKVWQAVQRIPHRNPASTNKNENVDSPNFPVQKRLSALKQKRYLKTRMVIVFLLVLYISALFVVPGWILEGELKIKNFYTCILSIPIYAAVVSTTAFQGDATITLYRDAEGKLANVTHKDRSTLSTTISAVLGVPTTAGALWFGYPLAVLLSLFTLALILNGPTLVLTSATVTTFLHRRRNGIPMVDGVLYSFVARGDPFVDWRYILIYACCSILQFQFPAMAYRFDYVNSLPSGFRPLVGRKPNIGFRIPSLRYYPVGEAFPRPYFSVALAALIISYVAIAALSTAGFIEVIYEFALIASMTLSLIVMASSMLALATMKGQFGKLWRYEEDWTAIPSPNELEIHEADIAEQEDANVHGKGFLLFDLDDERAQSGQHV